MDLNKIDKKKKKRITICFYVISIPVLVVLWFQIALNCFSLFSTDYVCEEINRVKLTVFYFLAIIWLLAPVIINKYKSSLCFGITIVGLLSLAAILFSYTIYNKRLDDISRSLFYQGIVCDYTEVYKKNNNKYSGIYECDDQYVFYREIPNNTWEYFAYKPDDLVNDYNFGYISVSTIDNYFHGFPYFYSHWGDKDGLRIALTAESEDDLISTYTAKLYLLIHELTMEFDDDDNFYLTIYYNDSFDGINNTYDKFFLNAGIKYKNQSIFTKRKQYAPRHLKSVINSLFSDSKFPDEAKEALYNNRHISVVIENPKRISRESLKSKLKNSFVKYKK